MEQLNDDLIGTSVKQGPKQTTYEVINMEGEFTVRLSHIIKLLKDIMVGKIDAGYLTIISFAVLSSDKFNIQRDTEQGEIIKQMLFEWCSPEISYSLNLENIKECLLKLENFKHTPGWRPRKPLAELLIQQPTVTEFEMKDFSFSNQGIGQFPLLIRFNPPNNVSWIGRFEKGPTRESGIKNHTNKECVYIIAGGWTYIVDLNKKMVIDV